MMHVLFASSLVLVPVQVYSDRLGPGFDDGALGGEFHRIVLGDVDSDGRADAMFWSYAGVLRVQRNTAFGRFEDFPVSLPPESLGQENTKFVVGELNGDGLLDLCLSREIGPGTMGPGVAEVLLGDGAGGFTLAASFSNDFPFNRAADDLELVDLDGDGDLDVLQSSYGVLRAHRNLGAGQFDTAGVALYTHPGNQAAAVTPFDYGGDGDLDLAVAINLEDGFVLEQVTPTSFVPTATLGDADGSPFVADLNGDGLVDVVVAEIFASSGAGGLRAYLQTGSGLSLLQEQAIANQNLIEGLADLDGDGQVDLVLSNYLYGIAQSVPGLPGGAFDFGAAAPLEEQDAPARDLALGDLDGDGDLDFVARSSEYGVDTPRLFLGEGDGRFVRIGGSVQLGLQGRGSLVDMDQDGDPDLVQLGGVPFAFQVPTPGVLYRNDGLGELVPEQQPGYVLSSALTDYDLGDLDGDGDVDALVGAVAYEGEFPFTSLGPERNLVLLNDGVGGLQEAPGLQLATADFSELVHLFDADGDGDLDAFLGNSGPVLLPAGENRLVLNDGLAGFSDATGNLPLLRASSEAGSAVDFDGDGDLDLLVSDAASNPFGGVAAAQPRLWLNDGSGSFADATGQLPAVPVSAGEVLIEDLDQDGDQDALIVGSFDAPFGPTPELLLINDGSANFAVGSLPTGYEPGGGSAFLDVDLDGDPDLVRFRDGVLTAYRNSGGALGPVEQLGGPLIIQAGNLAAADLDNDGDQDLIAGFTIVRSQITEAWAATPVSVGKEFVFELRAPGAGSGYLLAYSTGLIALELPGLGLLRLDPTVASAVLGTGVLDAQGAAQVLGTLPAAPSLAGLTVYVQALLGAPARLSRAFGVTLVTL